MNKRRFLICGITLLWGVIVFLPGSVLVGMALQQTALAVLPLFIALLVIGDGKTKWQGITRRIYAGFLVLQGIVFWGGFGAISYCAVSVILLWPELHAVFRKGKTAVVLVLGLLVPFIWWNWFHNPLPSDQQLIDQFTAHRGEFEQLAQGYRNHRAQGFYDATAEALTLMRKAGVNGVVTASGQFGEWLPEPYSEHTLQVRKFLEVRPIEQTSTKEEVLETYNKEFPQLFAKTPPVKHLYEFSRLVDPTIFDLGPDPAVLSWGVSSLRYFGTPLNKGLCYYPQPPRVENGHIVNASFSLRDNAYTRPGLRVFDSLDRFPPDWKRGECVVKRIDGNWFIFMCRVAL